MIALDLRPRLADEVLAVSADAKRGWNMIVTLPAGHLLEVFVTDAGPVGWEHSGGYVEWTDDACYVRCPDDTCCRTIHAERDDAGAVVIGTSFGPVGWSQPQWSELRRRERAHR